MKSRIVAVISAVLMIFSLSGCGASEPAPGEELILAAREWYSSLDSARVDVVNDATGESEQVFIFKYDEKDIMTYSYVGRSDGIYLAQYNNGYEQFTNDNGTVTVLDSSDLQFTAYSRDVPYPMADEGLILFYDRAIIPGESAVTEKDGVTEVYHKYDVTKLGQYDGEGELAGFDVTYRFAADGTLLGLTEVTTVRHDINDENSEVDIHSYTIYITECNKVERVENVVDISEIKD